MSVEDLARARQPDGVFSATVPLTALRAALIRQLAPETSRAAGIVWADGDSETLVFPAKLQLALRPGLLLVELPFATDQTGGESLLFVFQCGREAREAALLAVTEQLPRGDALLAARWGPAAQEIVWDAILRAGLERVNDPRLNHDVQLAGLYVPSEKSLVFLYTRPVGAAEVQAYYLGRTRPTPGRVAGRVPAVSRLRRVARPPRK